MFGLCQSPSSQFCGDEQDEAFEEVFDLKPFSLRCVWWLLGSSRLQWWLLFGSSQWDTLAQSWWHYPGSSTSVMTACCEGPCLCSSTNPPLIVLGFFCLFLYTKSPFDQRPNNIFQLNCYVKYNICSVLSHSLFLFLNSTWHLFKLQPCEMQPFFSWCNRSSTFDQSCLMSLFQINNLQSVNLTIYLTSFCVFFDVVQCVGMNKLGLNCTCAQTLLNVRCYMS